MKPTEGKGPRNIYCQQDGQCVGYAARMSWNAFHCMRCAEWKEKPGGNQEECRMEDEKKKACKKCGKEKALKEFPKSKLCKDGHLGMCQQCKSERQKERYHAKKGTGDKGAKTVTPEAPETGKVKIHEVTLLFSGPLAWMYEMLKGYAEEEMRSLDMQILHMLREDLRHDGMDEVYIELTEKGWKAGQRQEHHD